MSRIFDITSTSNSKYKHIRSLQKKKEREECGEYTVEGIKSVRDALDSGMVSGIAVSREFYENEAFDYGEVPVYIVKTEIFSGLCDTRTPQGIIAVVKMRNTENTSDISKIYIYCDCITDPGNAGTIIRTADAAGCGGVFFSEGSVDIYSPKTVRASMGSFFHIDIRDNAKPSDIVRLKEQGFTAVCGALCADTVDYMAVDMTQPLIIIVGNEANGVSDEVMSLCDYKVKIPIYGKAESLNAAVATAILMYEAARQRNKAQ